MRQVLKEFVKICEDCFDLQEPIYEFGALQVPGQESFADLRTFFENKKYVGSDYRLGIGVDVVLDLHNIELPSASVGSVLCLDTFEHVEYPWKAVDEINRILGANGILILTSVMNFPIHSYPHDYWRFTPEGFKSLLSSFNSSVIVPIGPTNFPENILAIAFKGQVSKIQMGRFQDALVPWTKYWNNKWIHSLKRIIQPIAPKKLIELYRQSRNLSNK